MKHNPQITIILLVMFVLAQLIGLIVLENYSSESIINNKEINNSGKELPYKMGTPKESEELSGVSIVSSIIFAFVIAIGAFFILSKFNAEKILRGWFLIVIVIALGISITSFLNVKYSTYIALGIALVLTFYKVFKRDILIHNLTELLIYPGIAAVFIPIKGFNLTALIVILLFISIYDMWAVWRSGLMQKMANYQIEKIKVFPGFFVPYLSEKMKKKYKKLKAKSKELKKKNKELSKKEKQSLKANVAMLGGGDIVFSTIAAGIMLKTYGYMTIAGFLVPFGSLMSILGATMGLSYLLLLSEKKKFYPAMPFITIGILFGIGIFKLITLYM